MASVPGGASLFWISCLILPFYLIGLLNVMGVSRRSSESGRPPGRHRGSCPGNPTGEDASTLSDGFGGSHICAGRAGTGNGVGGGAPESNLRVAETQPLPHSQQLLLPADQRSR